MKLRAGALVRALTPAPASPALARRNVPPADSLTSFRAARRGGASGLAD